MVKNGYMMKIPPLNPHTSCPQATNGILSILQKYFIAMQAYRHIILFPTSFLHQEWNKTPYSTYFFASLNKVNIVLFLAHKELPHSLLWLYHTFWGVTHI
jgi:hypothetical protein